MLKNKKGVELPINVLVTLALVVFVVFLVLGFLTGGWGYFAGIFGKTTKTQTPLDAARQDCKSICSQYTNEGSPVIDVLDTTEYWYGKLIASKTKQDLNGDGKFDESYSCRGDLRKPPATDNILRDADCPVVTVCTPSWTAGAWTPECPAVKCRGTPTDPNSPSCSSYLTETDCTTAGCTWATQTRTYTDSNNCGTTTGKPPDDTRKC